MGKVAESLIMEMLTTAYQQYSRAVHSTAFQLTHSSTAADDVMQDVFVKAHKELSRGTYIKNMKSWLYRATITTALDSLKRKRPKSLVEASYSNDPFHSISKQEDVHTLLQAIKQLPNDERITLVLFELQDLSHQEICELTGHSIEKIKIDLHRARNRLREIFFGQNVIEE